MAKKESKPRLDYNKPGPSKTLSSLSKCPQTMPKKLRHVCIF